MNAPNPAPGMFQVPPALLAVALAFWGWQTKNGYAAAGFALVMLLPVLTRLRLELAERDQHRIADLTMILYVAVAASLIATESLRAGVHESLVWLPGVMLPLMLAQTMCVEGRVPLTALFRYLRKLKARGVKVQDPQVDLTGPYLALVLIAAGMANQPGYGYFAGIVLIVAAALVRIRPSRVGIAAWMLALAVSTGAGFGVQSGLYTLQTLIEDWIIDWQLGGPLLDPYRSSTRIGELGRLKAEDAIVMRVYASRDATDRPVLLHRASYNQYAGTTWIARQGNLEVLTGRGDGTVFLLGGTAAVAAPADTRKVRISERVRGGRTLLALPLNASAVSDLVASRVRSNPLGAVQAEMEVPWTFYYALYSPGAAIAPPGYAAAGAEDLHVPERERRTLEAVARQLGLAGMAPAAAVQRVMAYFAGFEYSTVRNHPFSELAPRSETPLAEFLNTTHRGHCEYFATAATLLLRTAGIPARYATGYSIQDWSSWEEAWIVRERHSHAWARAYVDGQWRDIDATPAAWFAEEESLAPASQRLADFLRWAGFRWTTRDGSETRILAWAVVALAAVILVWKLVSEGGLVRLAQRAGMGRQARPGDDSEFYAVEAALAKRVPRRASEPVLEWLPRAGAGLEAGARAELERLAALHYRYRFDPAGLAANERAGLSKGCSAMLAVMRRA
ncbi:MAG: transglutaminase domain-containing protein [Proteobacteria bacterium]|nr:transglutaminase domain-containing protein [Pseudomonadota bacterium]